MAIFILRRLLQSALTILGVMIITFLLFRVVAGDIAAANVGMKATQREKAAWRQNHGYDKPLVLNLHRRLLIRDTSKGPGALAAEDVKQSRSAAADALALVAVTPAGAGSRDAGTLAGKYLFGLNRDTPLSSLTESADLTLPPTQEVPQPAALIEFSLRDGSELTVDLTGARTAGELIDRINTHGDNRGRLQASISQARYGGLFNSQFFNHLKDSITFQSRSFKDERKLTSIIAEKAPYSLALTVPVMAIEFVLGLALALVVAYFRGSLIDHLGVFFSVLGMCVPFLAFMIYGQWLMFKIAPAHAYGIFYRANLYVPISIMVVAGLGGLVRFYRTIILDETGRDYVRTAAAKGVGLGGILFKHVLKNCMLPILTNLILSIPFLILGSLLVESYFGVPGLGDLMVSSIASRNEPILSGLVFLTALVYSLGVLVTDLTYALFDPRIRLG